MSDKIQKADLSRMKEDEKRMAGLRKAREMELVHAYHVIDISPRATTRNHIDCRLYMGRGRNASVVHCCLWVQGEKYAASHAAAGGWNYDKKSQAVNNAIIGMGIDLEFFFGGSGESGTRLALLAIAIANGAKKPIIVESYA